MKIIPAIDVLNGQVVRLRTGDREQATNYALSPEQALENYAQAGAKRVHVVDLSGAFVAEERQAGVLENLVVSAKAMGLQLQVGGGLRTAQQVVQLLESGVQWAVVGTLATRDPLAIMGLCMRFPGQIIVAADTKQGRVATHGWESTSEITPLTLALSAASWGAAAILHTVIERDGTELGPDFEATLALQKEVPIPVFASGGVGTLEHIRQAAALGVHGIVIGRALYEQKFTLQQAEAIACSNDASFPV